MRPMPNVFFANHIPPRPPNRRVRVALRLADWPEQDRVAWELACAPGDLFEDGGVGAHLRPRTRTSLINTYGRWLGFLAQSHADLLLLTPSDRVTRERIGEFCDMLALTNTGI